MVSYVGTLLATFVAWLIVVGLTYGVIFAAGLFVWFVMRSFDRLVQLTMQSFALWVLGVSILVLAFETLGRFFLLSIDIQLQFATHILGILLMHILYFVVAGLAVRALLVRYHRRFAGAYDAVLFMAFVAICFYFVLGSVAGMVQYTLDNYKDTTMGKIIVERYVIMSSGDICRVV